ncbi:beta strand repeat-containing protein [Fibrivirga algicola]|nr:TMF family protein [Fibrivirga algicola]
MWKFLLFTLGSFSVLTLNVNAQTNYVSTAPSSLTPGSDNTLVGVGAGNINMSGASNLMIGRGAGIQNMAGTQNAFVGAGAGNRNSSGQNNAFLGYSSGYNTSSGNNNTFLGANAGYTNDIGYNNSFAGYNAGYFNSQGNNNAFFGTGSGYGNTQGSNNTFMGADAGSNNSTGTGNTYLGSLSGTASGSASQNTFVGANTGISNIGSSNTFIGYEAGRSNQSGSNNVFIGYYTGVNNTTGLGNLFMGQQAGLSNSQGSYNLFIGNSSGSSNVGGIGNTAIGDGSLLRNASGIHNAAIGRYAGVESRGDENVFIGFAADVTPATPNLVNVTAIGARARVSQSNSIVLGANANVGIGTSAPAAKLEIVSSTTNTSGLRLTNLKSSSPATVLSTNKFLTVNANGDVVLGSTTSSARLGTEAADANWQSSGINLVNTNTGGVIIGQGIDKTPAGYRLFVSEGILTEKVKVAVANTSEWSDKVFEKSYNLRSLRQVEQHIKQHGHLPGVPSAVEVVRDGVDVGKMDAKLLEKIEELTLYMIELKKETQALKAENKRIKQQLRLNTRR